MENSQNKLTLEQAGAQLDALISRLENTALPLQESVEIYTKACKLLAYCMNEVKDYQKKAESVFETLAPYLNGEGDPNA